MTCSVMTDGPTDGFADGFADSFADGRGDGRSDDRGDGCGVVCGVGALAAVMVALVVRDGSESWTGTSRARGCPMDPVFGLVTGSGGLWLFAVGSCW